MKLFGWKKSVEVPSGDKVQLEGLETWIVHWTSRYSTFSSGTQRTAQAFTNREDAEKFRLALKDAFKLVKNTADDHVEIEVIK